MAPTPPPLPRTVILDYYDSCKSIKATWHPRTDKVDTNNLLTLFTRLYGNKEVLDKVVVIKADHYEW